MAQLVQSTIESTRLDLAVLNTQGFSSENVHENDHLSSRFATLLALQAVSAQDYQIEEKVLIEAVGPKDLTMGGLFKPVSVDEMTHLFIV